MHIIYFPESHERDISTNRHHTSIPGAIWRLQEGNRRAVVGPVPRDLTVLSLSSRHQHSFTWNVMVSESSELSRLPLPTFFESAGELLDEKPFASVILWFL
jgi:hypothetical protein